MGDRFDLPGDFRDSNVYIKSTIYQQAAPQPVASEELTAAQQQLAALPLDTIPEPAPLPPGSRMPLSRNPLFVGREADLRALAAALKGGETAVIGQIAAATGLGGMGKTQLASEFVHRYGQFFAGGVFWLSLADAATVPAQVAVCGGPGGLALRPDFSTLPLEDQVQRVLSAWQSPLPRLLICDNCEEEPLLAQWRPPSGGSRVLVTSRRLQWDPTLGVQALALGVLSRKESIALLRQHRPDLPADDPDLDAIADALGDLPLALHLAGSYLARYRYAETPAGYLAQLKQPDLLQHRSLQTGGWSPTGHEQHVARTFALSYRRLDAADDTDVLALALLARAAYFAPGEPIPRALLQATVDLKRGGWRFVDRTAHRTLRYFRIGWNWLLWRAGSRNKTTWQTEDALARLATLGLLEVEAAGALRLHRLLAVFVQRETGDPAIQTAVEEAILTEVNRANSGGYPGPVLAWQPHLRAITDAARARADERAAALCNQLGYHLHMIGDYAGARPYWERALAIREQVLGAEHPDTAQSLNNLGSLLQAQGDLAGARAYYERALAIYEQVLGAEHPDTANSLNNLGVLLQDQGDLAGARPYFERALRICCAALGEQHPSTQMVQNNLEALLAADEGPHGQTEGAP